ncbi:FKBP-type peptidyl-prolyl cis-trans isomerase [Candidatus Saccharibacteria bacterium]|nr:FKBP-type peptidyl-prolyl cis-trans isomerase [Candidatus Saccharibacteria bacterium]
MDQEMLKTSKKQRLIIAVIAILVIGSFIASYAAIVLMNGSDSNLNDADRLIAKYQEQYYEQQKSFATFSRDDFNKFIEYKGRISAYNESNANAAGLQYEDLAVGDGRTLAEGDKSYYAYYVGWCPNEEIFDSTFNANDNPASFTGILDADTSLIAGWESGVVGMNINGIREITIPGELAYKEQEMCGGQYKPLKFIIMAKEKTAELNEMYDKLSLARTKYQYAQYGIDYDKQMAPASDDEAAEGAE